MNEKKFIPDLKVNGNISNLFVRQSKCRENGQFVIGFGITRYLAQPFHLLTINLIGIKRI